MSQTQSEPATTLAPGDIEVLPLPTGGMIPNNPKLPLILYRRVLPLDGGDPDDLAQHLFRSNGWGKSWVNGIYAYHHYHSTAHEVLGISRGWARVMLGGPDGVRRELSAGDVVLIPTGVGHCLAEAEGLSVVGAYPRGQDWDLCRAIETDRAKAMRNIPRVPLPQSDPVFGDHGPVHEHWLR